jgi:Bifunctional DNA primase/polymerase, N-terminal
MSAAPCSLPDWGYVYGQLGLAICWTATNDPAKGDPKRGRAGWPDTARLPDGPFGSALFKHHLPDRNPAVVLRASGLVGVDCDTETRLEELRALGLPPTVTVRSSEPYKLHYWFRPPGGRVPEFAAFRFEDAGVTADKDRLFLVPPARHPSGTL